MTSKTKVCLQNHLKIFCCVTPKVKVCIHLENLIFVSKCNDFSLTSPCLTEESSGTYNCSFHQCIGRGSQWGCSHLEIRLGISGYQHSCDRQFGSSSLSDLEGAYTG